MKSSGEQTGAHKSMPTVIKIILAIIGTALFIGLLYLQAKTGSSGFSCH